MKSGGLDQAKNDFAMLDPRDIKVYHGGSKMGFVGDRLVHLETSEIPTLYVSGRRKTLTHEKGMGSEIVYFKRMPKEDNKNWQGLFKQRKD